MRCAYPGYVGCRALDRAMVERVGADDFVPEYSEREPADRIAHRIAALA